MVGRLNKRRDRKPVPATDDSGDLSPDNEIHAAGGFDPTSKAAPLWTPMDRHPISVQRDVVRAPYAISQDQAASPATDLSSESNFADAKALKILQARSSMPMESPSSLVAQIRARGKHDPQTSHKHFVADLKDALLNDGVVFEGWDRTQNAHDPISDSTIQGGAKYLTDPSRAGVVAGANRVGNVGDSIERNLSGAGGESANNAKYFGEEYRDRKLKPETAAWKVVGLGSDQMHIGSIQANAALHMAYHAHALAGGHERLSEYKNAIAKASDKVHRLSIRNKAESYARTELPDQLSDVASPGGKVLPTWQRVDRLKSFYDSLTEPGSPHRDAIMALAKAPKDYDTTKEDGEGYRNHAHNTFEARREFNQEIKRHLSKHFPSQIAYLKSIMEHGQDELGDKAGHLTAIAAHDTNNHQGRPAMALNIPTHTGYELVFPGAVSGMMPEGTSLHFDAKESDPKAPGAIPFRRVAGKLARVVRDEDGNRVFGKTLDELDPNGLNRWNTVNKGGKWAIHPKHRAEVLGHFADIEREIENARTERSNRAANAGNGRTAKGMAGGEQWDDRAGTGSLRKAARVPASTSRTARRPGLEGDGTGTRGAGGEFGMGRGAWTRSRSGQDLSVDSLEKGVKKPLPTVRTAEELRAAAEGAGHWKDWYTRHNDIVQNIFGEDTPLFQKFLGATSLRSKVSANVGSALKAYWQYKTGQPFEGHHPEHKRNLDNAVAGRPITGPKISQYSDALAGKTDATPIDMHVADMLYGTDKPTPRMHTEGRQHLLDLASHLGWEPRGVQAALWAANQIRQGGEPQSYDTHFKRRADQIKQFRAAFGDGSGASVDGRDGGGERPDAPDFRENPFAAPGRKSRANRKNATGGIPSAPTGLVAKSIRLVAILRKGAAADALAGEYGKGGMPVRDGAFFIHPSGKFTHIPDGQSHTEAAVQTLPDSVRRKHGIKGDEADEFDSKPLRVLYKEGVMRGRLHRGEFVITHHQGMVSPAQEKSVEDVMSAHDISPSNLSWDAVSDYPGAAGDYTMRSWKNFLNMTRKGIDWEVVDGEFLSKASVFPVPRRMLGNLGLEHHDGGRYIDAQSKEELSDRTYSNGKISVDSGDPHPVRGSRVRFDISDDQVEPGTSRGGRVKVNLFKQKAGWKWHGDSGDRKETTVVSTEHGGGKHTYALEARFHNPVTLARYPDAPSEPRLRPTTRGTVNTGDVIGHISVRGRVHPVHSHVAIGEPDLTVKASIGADGEWQGDPTSGRSGTDVIGGRIRSKMAGTGDRETNAFLRQSGYKILESRVKDEESANPVNIHLLRSSKPAVAGRAASILRPTVDSEDLHDHLTKRGFRVDERPGGGYIAPDGTRHQFKVHADPKSSPMAPVKAPTVAPVTVPGNEKPESPMAPVARRAVAIVRKVATKVVGPSAVRDADAMGAKNLVKDYAEELRERIKARTLKSPTKKGFVTAGEIATYRSKIAQARRETDTDPTIPQKDSGNYRKGRVRLHGLSIAIENPKGSIRRGCSKSGKEWSVKMGADYGYFTRTNGHNAEPTAVDGDALDCFIGDHPESEAVFVVSQVDRAGKFDEYKVILGCRNEAEARATYLSCYSTGWTGFGKIDPTTMEDLRTQISGIGNKEALDEVGRRMKLVAKGVPGKEYHSCNRCMKASHWTGEDCPLCGASLEQGGKLEDPRKCPKGHIFDASGSDEGDPDKCPRCGSIGEKIS